jgi:signal transduction histidine kinase
MNGYEVLETRRATPELRDIPFVVVSALDDIASVVRCIAIGAEDYLPKPFDPILLQARVTASLDKKRLRDQELAYLRDVRLVTDAARAVEDRTFESESLANVAAREDELGNLARMFQRMAREVFAREERHRALAQMVAGVAHEINTPLGIVNTASSILRRQLGSEEIGGVLRQHVPPEDVEDLTDTLTLMAGNVDRMSRLVQSFKNMSVSQIVDELEQFDFPALMAETIDLYRVSARQARITIEIQNQLPDGQNTWIGYRGYLGQVVLNLLTNVERYAYPDGSGGRVEVRLAVGTIGQRPAYVVSVQDFGQGMTAEQVERAFEPFFTTGRGKGGTGLGLAIVENIVATALQGTVVIESEPGQGTLVRVTIPRTIEKSDEAQ